MTKVGERGVRLSGGQRQRIGIARAMYHKPEVLILDEATNALDNFTEHAVIESMHHTRRNLTKIMITHRINSVKKCDNILLIDKGEIIAQGKYDKLIQENNFFIDNEDKTKKSISV